MAEEPTQQEAVLSAPAETRPQSSEIAAAAEEESPVVQNGTVADPVETSKVATASEIEEPVASVPSGTELLSEKSAHENTNTTQPDQPNSEQSQPTQSKPESNQEQDKMDVITKEDGTASATVSAPAAEAGTQASASKSSTKARRKSSGVPEHKGKKLNKKASKAKMTHLDAQPGDYFMIKLKGYPLWPGIVCDESMLPNTLIRTRPVTAAQPDGTYRDAYADGGAKVNDRTFPVMYLYTNEFSWIPNTDLVEMDVENIGKTPSSMRKDLAAAHALAAEQNDLAYYKEVLQNFMTQRAADVEAAEEAKAAAEATKAAKKAEKVEKATKPKKKSKAIVDEDEDAEGDTEMTDAPADLDDVEVASSAKKTKKRKATDNGEDNPKTDSVKKPKTTIKLNTTPKPKANGEAGPKSAKDSAKVPKPKAKKVAPKVEKAPEVVAPLKEPELTPEEKRQKREKEILFLRHKLQKGLLTKDQEPKEEEMKTMSEFVSKLEGYADLEVSIIRITKINKVLKAILKVHNIPKEEEYQFKPRSQSLLDKWNKLLASDQGAASATSAATNGVKDEVKPEVEEAKITPAATNGTKESSEEKTEEQGSAVEEPSAEPKEEPAEVDEAPAPSIEDPIAESKPESAVVESNV